MGFYDDIADVASELLGEFKQGVVTLTRETDIGVPIDVDAPWLGNTKTSATCTLDATVKSVGEEFVDGTTIEATDLEVMAAVFAVEPEPGETLTIDGRGHVIIKVLRIPAAGTPVAWKLIVKA